MVSVKYISESDCLYAVKNREFSAEIINSSADTAVIMSQDWCPQWLQMERYIGELSSDTDKDIVIYVVLYNKMKCFNEFMSLKEKIWNNSLIPYVRYYHNGEYKGFSNYLWKDAFIEKFS